MTSSNCQTHQFSTHQIEFPGGEVANDVEEADGLAARARRVLTAHARVLRRQHGEHAARLQTVQRHGSRPHGAANLRMRTFHPFPPRIRVCPSRHAHLYGAGAH